MARVTIEDCLKNVESRFYLVHLAVRRVLQLRSGATPLVNAPKNKEIVVSLREIAAGKITLDNIRKFEVIKPLPEEVVQEKTDVKSSEVKEILDEATQFDASMEYSKSESVEEDQDED